MLVGGVMSVSRGQARVNNARPDVQYFDPGSIAVAPAHALCAGGDGHASVVRAAYATP